MHRGRAAGLKPQTVPLTDAQKAVRQAKRERNMAKAQERITALLRALQRAGIDISRYMRELPFYGMYKSKYPWRFDLAVTAPDFIAIEIDGSGYAGKPCPVCGQRPGGRHSRGDRDRERAKLNEAQALGWRVFTFSAVAIDRHVDECAAVLKLAHENTRKSIGN